VKTLLLSIGILFLLFFLYIVSFFFRVGKPVNASLSDSYYHHYWKNKIIYSPMGNWFELGYSELEANPTTFQVLSREFAKDEKTVFWRGYKQALDVGTFRVDEKGIPKDKHQVYYDEAYGDSLTVIEDADPLTYEQYTPPGKNYYHRWGRDAAAYFLDGVKVEVDRETFSPVNETLALDTFHLYILKRSSDYVTGTGAIQLIQKAPRPEGVITVISDNYLQVGNRIVLSNWKNDFALLAFDVIQSLRVVDERNLVVNGVLISDGKRMEEVDLATLEIIDRDFMKDAAHVYYDTHLIPSADPASFTPVYEAYSKDKNAVFYKNTVLKDASPATFTYDYASGVASDGALSFKEGVRVDTSTYQ
jgi:DKNYY family